MKVTGYTIIYFLLSVLLLWGFVEFEIWGYNKLYKSKIKEEPFIYIFFNLIVIIAILFYLDEKFNMTDNIDKLLKKRIL